MLLVQQAHHPLTLSSMSTLKHISPPHHRRIPSAPAVVQPGIIVLPQRPPRQATPRQHRTPKVPHTAQSPQLAEREKDKHRGRVQSGREKASKPARQSSKSRAGHGGKARQPSPSPLSSSEQTPTDETTTSSSKLNTTLLSSGIQDANADAITLSVPSGRLAAKRRNRNSVPVPPSASVPLVPATKQPKRSQTPPAKTKAVAVPMIAKPKTNTLPISASVPAMGHMPRSRVRREIADIFPVCDDVDDGLERPSTPSPSNGKTDWLDERGPLTAPINAEPSFFFPSSSPPRFEHRRAPSVPADSSFSNVFDSDEGSRSESSAFFPRPRMDGSVRSLSTPVKKAGINTYASSMFQNSPSPEHLPPPSFSLASMKRCKALA